MNLSERKDKDVTILAVQGRLDSATSPEVDKRIGAMIDGGVRLLVLDCAALEYVSSAGLRTILAATKRIRAAQGKLAVAAPAPQVKEILDIAGFSGMMPIVATIDAAMQACKA